MDPPWAVQYTDLIFLPKEAMRMMYPNTPAMDVGKVYRLDVLVI